MRLQSASALALATAGLCCVISAAPVEATPQQPPPIARQQQAGPNALLPNPLFDRIPGAAQMPAMDWIKPGMRLVFFSTNATLQSNPGQAGMRRDPNGEIIDSNGDRWTMTAPTGESGGGVGYTVVDVVASEPPPNGALVLQNHLYFLPQGKGGPAVLTGSNGYLSHPTGLDFFLHPRLLAQVPSMDAQTVNILRQQYDLNNQRFSAIRVTIMNQGIASSVYDLTSGVLLFGRFAGMASKGQVLDPNGYVSNASARASGTHTFVSARQVALPWINSQMPSWVRQVKKLRYSGQMISRSPATQGLPDLATPLVADITVKQLGATWCMHEVVSELSTNVGVPNVPSRAEIVTGPASIDGVWKDPNFLKQLQTGQTLDQDQSIGTQTVVEFAGAGNDMWGGRAIVAISIITAQQRTTKVYDASDGKLIQIIRTESNPGTSLTTIVQLNLVGVE